MKISACMLVAGSVLLTAAELVPFSPISFGLVNETHAIVGAPMTPVSAAGVARRTAVRTTEAVAVSNAAAASAAAAKAPPPPPPPAPPPAAGPLAIGTVVGQLPAGCVSAPVSGIEYYLCGGNYYRAVFQGNNLVYVVAKP